MRFVNKSCNIGQNIVYYFVYAQVHPHSIGKRCPWPMFRRLLQDEKYRVFHPVIQYMLQKGVCLEQECVVPIFGTESITRGVRANVNESYQEKLRQNLWAKMLAAMFLGVLTGLAVNPSAGLIAQDIGLIIGNWLALPGKLFLSLIQMIVVPLVVASIIRGIAGNEDIEFLKKMGLRVALYYIAATCMAVTIGISVAILINPGNYLDKTALNLDQEASLCCKW